LYPKTPSPETDVLQFLQLLPTYKLPINLTTPDKATLYARTINTNIQTVQSAQQARRFV